MGFSRGLGHPAVVHHAGRGLLTLVHGDDYATSGEGKDLDWLEGELNKKYKLKTQRLANLKEGEEYIEAKVLNIIVRKTKKGFEVEADPRHCGRVLDQMDVAKARALSTPGSDEAIKDKEEEEEEEEEEEDLQGDQIRMYRAISARLNCLSQDRPDITFIVKEACREMSRCGGALLVLHYI